MSSDIAPRWAGWAIWFLLLVFLLVFLALLRGVDPDLFHEMALIREALALGRLPREDVFAFTSTVSPSVHHEWGTGAILYLVTVGLGLGGTGLVLLRFLLLGGIIAFCFSVARKRGAGGVELALAAPLAILLFIPGMALLRAHMFTFLFLAVLLYMLEADREGARRWILLWLPLHVLWVNLHGGWVVGAGMLGLYWLESFVRQGRGGRWRDAFAETRHLLLAAGATLPLLLLNPYGFDYVPFLWEALLLDRPFIVEWAPLWAAPYRTIPLPLFVVSVLVLLYTLRRGDGWKALPGALLVLVAGLVAVRSVRILPIYVIVWTAYVPAALAHTPFARSARDWWRRRARATGAAALALGSAGLWATLQIGLFAPVVPGVAGTHHIHYPVGPVQYLDETGFGGNLMTPFATGAFVSWHLYPQVRVGMDSRYEVAYDPALVEEAMAVYQGFGDWRAFLHRHPVDAVLVSVDDPLDGIMARAEAEGELAWTEVYRDDGFAIFARPEVAAGLPVVDRRGERIVGTFP